MNINLDIKTYMKNHHIDETDIAHTINNLTNAIRFYHVNLAYHKSNETLLQCLKEIHINLLCIAYQFGTNMNNILTMYMNKANNELSQISKDSRKLSLFSTSQIGVLAQNTFKQVSDDDIMYALTILYIIYTNKYNELNQ